VIQSTVAYCFKYGVHEHESTSHCCAWQGCATEPEKASGNAAKDSKASGLPLKQHMF